MPFYSFYLLTLVLVSFVRLASSLVLMSLMLVSMSTYDLITLLAGQTLGLQVVVVELVQVVDLLVQFGHVHPVLLDSVLLFLLKQSLH